MKIIDKTPWQDENGEISIFTRIQATFRHGLNWYGDLEAQKAVMAQLNQSLEKGFVLIRNFTLPRSEIIIPLILIGPGGIQVIDVTNAKGYFEAKGDQWNIINGKSSKPAPVNYISRIVKLAKAFEKYLEINKLNPPGAVEPVLIASDPGAQVESVRPAARVVRSDAIRQYAGSLIQARPVFQPGAAFEFADQIIDPRLRKREEAPAKPVSRAQAIFNSSESAGDFNANDLGFEFEETQEKEVSQPQQTSAPVRSRKPAAKTSPTLGMTRPQLMIFVAMFIVECIILTVFSYLLYTLP